jgi:hypothetical protein
MTTFSKIVYYKERLSEGVQVEDLLKQTFEKSDYKLELLGLYTA